MVADVDDTRPPRAYGLLVLVSLAILVSLLAVLCTLHHTSRLEEELHGQLELGGEATEPSQSSLGFGLVREDVP
jgi:hypothetical protein